MSLKELKPLFAKYNFRPKKRLGQHFLIDDNISDKIIASAGLTQEDIVVEIGAGAGDIALRASPIAKHVVAVEKDKLLCAILEDRFKNIRKVELICADILKLDLAPIFGADNSVKIIGNLPYYITTPIIFHLLEYKKSIRSIFIAIQREVADRITADAGGKDYGVLTCSVQYHTRPRQLFNIGKDCFYPAPEVDSAFLRMDMQDEPSVRAKDEKLLFSIIRSGFNQRRKTLLNALSNLINPAGLPRRRFAPPRNDHFFRHIFFTGRQDRCASQER